MACIIDSWVPTASMTLCAPSPRVWSLTAATPGVAAFGDDVGGAEFTRELLTVGVSTHGDDAFGTKLFGCHHPEQSDRTVTDDNDCLAGPGLGGDGAEPAGAQHIGGGQQARNQVGRRQLRCGHQCFVGQRDAGVLGLGADAAHQSGIHAPALVPSPADLAGVVGGEERPDDELSGFDGGHVAADLFDDAHVLVAHRGRGTDLLNTAPWPQVTAADTGRRDTDDGVGRLDDLRVRPGSRPGCRRGRA